MNKVPTEKITERKELRKEILRSFYDHNYKTGGMTKKLNAQISEDPEVAAAHHYLIDTGLLYAENHKGVLFTVKISPRGIDFIENDSNF